MVFHISFISSLVSVCRNEEKLIALLLHPSFRRVATSMLRIFFIFTTNGSQVSQTESKRAVNVISLRFQYSVTAQLGGRNSFDVNILLATKDVRTYIQP